MHEFHPNMLWIGHAHDVRNPKLLFDAGIAAVVDVAYEEPAAQLPRGLIYCRFPLNDGGGNEPAVLRLAVQTTLDLLCSEIPALVGCSAGMSRSPTIAAFALAIHLQESPDETIQRVVASKSLEVSIPLWTEVRDACSQLKRSSELDR